MGPDKNGLTVIHPHPCVSLSPVNESHAECLSNCSRNLHRPRKQPFGEQTRQQDASCVSNSYLASRGKVDTIVILAPAIGQRLVKQFAGAVVVFIPSPSTAPSHFPFLLQELSEGLGKCQIKEEKVMANRSGTSLSSPPPLDKTNERDWWWRCGYVSAKVQLLTAKWPTHCGSSVNCLVTILLAEPQH